MLLIKNTLYDCHVTAGLEEVVAAELGGAHIQASNVTTGSSGVYFSGTADTGYRACLWLRAATRCTSKSAVFCGITSMLPRIMTQVCCLALLLAGRVDSWNHCICTHAVVSIP